MVIDTSAIAALFLNEPECARFAELIAAAATRLISAATVVEAGIVIEARLGDAGAREFELFLHHAQLKIVPVDASQAAAARAAWRSYGKGRHPASLNLGDCFSYALAELSGEPLLAKGTDFIRTGISVIEA
ncbi:type II toxin-antitoxin system VapC family toxin [Silvibacterium dinghuense]|uniref:Ribonuclease VapC n=2 Tax=Silvibacterium dinghuense TaxID=1560006 RepID=A0A4Q1SKH7_9BACT|nr:type II toxin-antitoxin system VapC family toxin [Silvibacterium dinghuense]